MKRLAFLAALLAIALLATSIPVLAGDGGGVGNSIPDNGKHFNLNFIGVEKGKTADMDNPDRHTVFVSLGKNEAVTTKIYVVPNVDDPDEFAVIDGNGTDGVAIIAVPFEYYGTLSYNVYATALGKPNKSVHVDATAVFDDFTEGALLMTEFDLTSHNKQPPKAVNISDIFRASGWIDENENGIQDAGDTIFTNVWVFNVPTLEEYFWDYTNSGLKLMQVRFYETTSGSWETVTTSPV